jgi:hypothetical protein
MRMNTNSKIILDPWEEASGSLEDIKDNYLIFKEFILEILPHDRSNEKEIVSSAVDVFWRFFKRIEKKLFRYSGVPFNTNSV